MGMVQQNSTIFLMSLVMLVGCTEVTPPVSQEIYSRSVNFSVPKKIEDLAGTWEYQDLAGQGTITLNVEGKGTYEWEEGQLETLSFEYRTWTGTWRQKGNDREGGFKLTFSEGSPVAQGEWWYTRIGNDQEPLQSGGSFKMSRSSPVRSAQ